MAEKITVEFDVEDNGSSAIAKINGELNETKKAGEGAAEGNKKTSMSLTDLNSAIQIAEQAFGYLKEAYSQTAGATLEYAEQVRQLSSISGESTESTSRFIQVLDDYKLSAEDALTATRTLTKNGYAPNIESLAKLSDEYLSLNTAQEKNDFILKNLGRSGLGWVEVLQKGSTAIREQGAAVSDNLVLSQKMVDAARENEIAVDNWNDSVQGLKISIGNQLLPVMTDFVNHMNAGQRAAEILAEQGLKGVTVYSKEYQAALSQAKEEIKATSEAMMEQADATDSAAAAAEEYTRQIEESSAVNREFLSILGNMQSEADSFAEKYQKVNEDASLSDDERKVKLEELALAHEEANHRIILGLLERKLTQDGILDDAELQWLLEKGVAWGIYSQTVVDETQKAIQEANTLISTIAAIPTSKDIALNVAVNGMPSNLNLSNTPAPVGTRRKNAAGGSYMIPMAWGNEGMPIGSSDTASGGELISITPKGQSQNAELIAAIQNNRMDERKLARYIVNALAQAGG